MIFDIKPSENKKVRDFYNNAIKSLNDFYHIDWNKNMPKVILVSCRKDFDTLYAKKTEDWTVGSTMNDSNKVYLLSPEVYEKESIHRYSDLEYETLLRHELSHLYTEIYFKEFKPGWLLEGIAIYSSGELEQKEKVKEFKNFLQYFDYYDSGIYEESGFAVLILDKEFGREKLLEFLKSLNGFKNEEDLKKRFKKIYGIELEYDWFNERINKYI